MIGARLVTATFGDGFRPFHHQTAAHWTDSAGRFAFDNILTIGIIGTTIKDSKASAFLNHLALVTDGTFHSG